MNFVKIGAVSNALKAGDIVTGNFASANEVPVKYWDKEENPDYDPSNSDSQERIYINTFVAEAEVRPSSGSYQMQEDGTWLDVTTEAEKLSTLIESATEATTEFIQSVVDSYNIAQGVVFTNVHNCASYINNPTYTHYPFCKEVWDWNVEVWEAARNIQSQVISGTIEAPETKEDFWSMLPLYSGTTTPQ